VNPEATGEDLLVELDWDHMVKCEFRACRWEATSLVLANPGPDHCLHTSWLPVCKGHEASMRAGHHPCLNCRETLTVAIIRTMKESK
jgi:hypothetical protein